MLGTTVDAAVYLDPPHVKLGRVDAAAVERRVDFAFDVQAERGGGRLSRPHAADRAVRLSAAP